jgi:hypothetical protein
VGAGFGAHEATSSASGQGFMDGTPCGKEPGTDGAHAPLPDFVGRDDAERPQRIGNEQELPIWRSMASQVESTQMSQAPGKLVVQHRSRGVALGTLDAFSAMRCFGDVTPEDVFATLKCSEIINAYRPEGNASIVALDPTCTFPSDPTRRAAVEVTRRTREQKVAQAVIVLGDGFWASAIRGFLTTMSSLSRVNFTQKVVRHEEEAVDWSIAAIGESTAKYRSALLEALAQLKPGTTVPPPSSTR